MPKDDQNYKGNTLERYLETLRAKPAPGTRPPRAIIRVTNGLLEARKLAGGEFKERSVV